MLLKENSRGAVLANGKGLNARFNFSDTIRLLWPKSGSMDLALYLPILVAVYQHFGEYPRSGIVSILLLLAGTTLTQNGMRLYSRKRKLLSGNITTRPLSSIRKDSLNQGSLFCKIIKIKNRLSAVNNYSLLSFFTTA